MSSPLLVCLFHLNLAFSSLEEDLQPVVIERCYWPMLAVAERSEFGIGIEAPGWTLERIEAHDPSWIAVARRLIEAGRLELVGSGYAQCAAPLLPAQVNRWNLRLGLEVYRDLLGARPRLALVSEQAYSPGLVSLYREAGYEGIIADWDNAYRSHPDWDPQLRRFPQRARGTNGFLPVVWSESIAFQKFQRFAHEEMTHEEYRSFIERVLSDRQGALMLYANDAEVFDHRPGRFAAEPVLSGGEWDRIVDGLQQLREAALGTPALPSAVLGLLDHPEAGKILPLESAAHPIPVKKQLKYNISRWAVSGRDDVGINTRCGRIFERLRDGAVEDPEPWRELCALWASDYRTHITEPRWRSLLGRLEEMERRWTVPVPERPTPPRPQAAEADGVRRDGNLWTVQAGPLEVVLNGRRGLCVHEFRHRELTPEPLFGTLEHGYFSTIDLGADWYSGNLVFEPPLRHKVTDLERVQPIFERTGDTVRVWTEVQTELGPVEKLIIIDGLAQTLTLEFVLHWTELPQGALRAPVVTVNPEVFEPSTLWYATHNGGEELERQTLGELGFDHGEAISALVSAGDGLGITEGVVLLGDAHRQLTVAIDNTVARPMGMIAFRPERDRYFLSLLLSLTESDDTRRGPILRDPATPQRLRVTVSASGATS